MKVDLLLITLQLNAKFDMQIDGTDLTSSTCSLFLVKALGVWVGFDGDRSAIHVSGSLDKIVPEILTETSSDAKRVKVEIN